MEIFSIPVETIHKAALGAGFLGAALAALGAGITLWTGAVLNQESAQQIESARATAERAKQSTERLRQENLKLEREIENQRAKRLELEERLGPRTLTLTQLRILNDMLVAVPDGTWVHIHHKPEPESESYALRIANALATPGTNARVDVLKGMILGMPETGVIVTICHGRGADIIRDALSAAGLGEVKEYGPIENFDPKTHHIYDPRHIAAHIMVLYKPPYI